MKKSINQKILDLTVRLVKLQTNPDNKEELTKALSVCSGILEEYNYTIENFSKDGCKSILVHNQKGGCRNFKVILNAHLDVIPGKIENCRARIEGDKLFGVGAMDMKGNLSALLYAFAETAIHISSPIALQIVTDEEIGGFNGTEYQIQNGGVTGEFVISSEPTNFNIVNKAKGVLWIDIHFLGRTAHGAYPWRGENAILQIVEFTNKLNAKFPNPTKKKWSTTVNFSMISSTNKAYNKVPDNATLSLDIRFIPNDKEKIINYINKILPKNASLNIITDEPAMNVDARNKNILLLKEIIYKLTGKKSITYSAQGSSDARHFAEIGIPGVEFGPIGKGIGSDSEWVSIESLYKYFQIIQIYLQKIT